MIIKRTIAFILALIIIVLVDAPLFTAYGAWALILCPIVGWCIGWVFMDIAEKI